MNFEPVFGEDNEIIGWTDENDNEWTLEEADTYWSITGNSPYDRTEQSSDWIDEAYEFVQTWVGW